MANTITQNLKSKLVTFGIFIIGIITGCALGLFITTTPNYQKKLLETHKIFDRDIVTTKNADTFMGEIVIDTDEEVAIKVGESVITLSRDKVKSVVHNYYAKYLKKAW